METTAELLGWNEEEVEQIAWASISFYDFLELINYQDSTATAHLEPDQVLLIEKEYEEFVNSSN